jgi:hypothetical protein
VRIPLFILLSGFSTLVLAQDKLDKDDQTRIRVERSAGGLGKITPEEKANANVGAGPHMERHGGAASREPREEPGQPQDSSRKVESKDARSEPRRP